MLGHGGGGSGGGFGGFPYRSSHQQGQDGRRNNNDTNRNNRSGGRGRGPPSRSRSNNNSNITYSAELDIPSEQRGMIVGKGGSTLKWLKDVTDSKIWVPHVQQQQRRRPRQQQSQQQQNHDQNQSFSSNAENNTSEQSRPNITSAATTQNNHPIRVNTTELSSLLHCFCEISSLLSQTNLQVSSIPCLVRMKSNASNNNNNNRNNGQAAMEVKVKGEVFIPSKPHTTIMPSHDYESDKKTPLSNKYACQDTQIFQGSITIPSSHQHAENASSTNTSPIQLPQHQLYAFALETILSEEDVATTVDNVQFVESSIDSCQWFYREVSHRYWSLDHAKNGASTIGTAAVAAAGNDNNNNNDGSSGVRVDASIRTINNECSDKISNHNRRLVFIFGSGNDHPEMLCNAIQEATDAAWMQSCFASLSAAKHNHAIEEQEHHSLRGEENPTVNTDDTYS